MSSLEKLFRREIDVPLPGIGTATIRNLSERDYHALYDGLGEIGRDSPEADLWSRRLICLTLVAINGEPVDPPLTVEQTYDLDLIAFRRLHEAAGVHCGFGGEDSSGNSHPANGTSGG